MSRTRNYMPTTKATIDRYFEALQFCIDTKRINNIYNYCLDYGIDRRNLDKQRKDRNRGYFECGWLNTLIECGISAIWLITGKGSMINDN